MSASSVFVGLAVTGPRQLMWLVTFSSEGLMIFAALAF